jgi:transposase-like protein
MKGVPFDVRVYLKAVEGYINGEETVKEVAGKAGISEAAFYSKLREYRATGKIEEPRRHPLEGPKALKRTREFNRVLRSLKRKHQDYGRTRLERELAKSGYDVSKNTVSRALADMGLSLPPKKGGSLTRRSGIRVRRQ